MTCVTWHDDEKLAEAFFASASQDEMYESYWSLWRSMPRWEARHEPTAERLKRLCDRMERVGDQRFGADWNIPF